MSLLAAGFPNVSSTVAPLPSFWSPSILPPYPTNAPWQNFVLANGTSPELVSPYLVKSEPGRLSFCYPSQTVQASFIVQAFISNLVFSTLEGLPTHSVSSYDDLSVTLSFGSSLSLPLVRGSPYITLLVNASTPVFSSAHAITNFEVNAKSTKFKLELNNGQRWIIYTSSPLSLSPTSLTASSPFSGVIRVALLPPTALSSFSLSSSPEAILDRHCPVYPLSGSATLSPFLIGYQWKAASWDSALGTNQLLMLTLRMHRKLLAAYSPSATPPTSPSSPCSSTTSATHASAAAPAADSVASRRASTPINPSLLVYHTIDGPAKGALGLKWHLKVPSIRVGWHSSAVGGGRAIVPGSQEHQDLAQTVKQDIASLSSSPIATSSTYFFGKAAARAARLGLIAEELGIGLRPQVEAVRSFLAASLTPWFNGTFPGNALLYDPKWGGIVSSAGAADQGADFGLGCYNDHHFHFGYFLYASAVLAKLDSSWGSHFKPQITALARDFANVPPAAPAGSTAAGGQPLFPRLRHFDFYALHSWASGLFEFADGRNQESFSEAVNAYYAVQLVGHVFADVRMVNVGATLAAVEATAAQMLVQVSPPPGNLTAGSYSGGVYDASYASANRLVGIVWANKRDSGLWFAPPQSLEMRTGIQVLPVTPYTAALYPNKKFVQQLVQWVLPALSIEGVTDQWRGFAWALQAIYDREGAAQNIRQLTAFDDGNSLSNMLWWAYTRA